MPARGPFKVLAPHADDMSMDTSRLPLITPSAPMTQAAAVAAWQNIRLALAIAQKPCVMDVTHGDESVR